MSAEARLAELKLELPPAPKPVGLYMPAVRVGTLLYVSGHGPLQPDGTLLQGKVGARVDQAQAVTAARQVGLTMLATLRNELGTLDRVVRLVKTTGWVNCTPDFVEQPSVINGFSELMIEIFGESGRGARSAVGTNALPGRITVEVEAIFEIKD